MTTKNLDALLPHAALTQRIVHMEGRPFTLRQMAALHGIYLYDDVPTCGDVALHLGVTRGELAHTLYSLLAAGLARREPHPDTRRKVCLVRTAAGWDFMARLAQMAEMRA
jgi:DNA-binding MarR family transcriptional regulator